MKLLLVVAAFVVGCIHAIPSIPRDNSHYVEGVSRYVWMTDGKGEPVLVDLEEPVDKQFLNTRNGANNQYWLFTRQNQHSAQVLVHNNINSVQNSNYNSGRPLKVIVHGWISDGNSAVNPLITSAFLAVQDANVIVVDWRDLASSTYTTAVAGVPSVGQHLGNFVTWLINNAGGNWNNVHFVGYSLGAHVVGVAGRQTGGRPSRITGLDPAGPGWPTNGNRLTDNAGQYVEAIHTDGGNQGIFNPSGHADFYPNGGSSSQPGCLPGVPGSPCSHFRAPELFASSVHAPNRFVGRRCNDIQQAQNVNCAGATLYMGNAVLNKRGTGLYGLVTGSSWPF